MPEIYLSYLFRYWQSGDKEKQTCQITLEDPHTREITAFNHLEDCIVHLQKQIVNQQMEAGRLNPGSENQYKGENH